MHIGLGATLLARAAVTRRLDGIGIYVENLANHFQQYPEITVEKYVYSSLFGKTKQLPGYHYFNHSMTTNTARFMLGLASDSLIKEKIQLYHAPDHYIPYLKKIPVVATVMDVIPLLFPELCNPWFREIKNYAFKRLAKNCQHIICISHAAAQDVIEQCRLDPKRVSVIPLAVDDRWHQQISAEQKQQILNKYQLPTDYLLFVGTLQPRKNIDKIIKAYCLLPDELKHQHHLVLVGKNGWRTDELLRDIQKLTDQGYCHWLNYVEQQDIYGLYQNAKMLLYPSLYEGFGFPVLEGFASGIPVLTSTTSSLPEVAGDAALLVDPNSLDAISQGMLQLLGDAGLCQNYIKKGLARVKTYNWQSCAQQTIAVYQQLIG